MMEQPSAHLLSSNLNRLTASCRLALSLGKTPDAYVHSNLEISLYDMRMAF